MKKIVTGIVTLMFVGSIGLAMVQEAQAGTKTPLAKKRLKWQKGRIKQGVKSGELTKDETKELKQDHKNLRQEIKDAKSDGKVTAAERTQIQKDENAESKKIYDLKHNDVKQGAGDPATAK